MNLLITENIGKSLKGTYSGTSCRKTVEEVQSRFAALIEGVSPTEISEMEQALINEGMPVEEVQRLCDVHAAVFKGSIEEIHRPENEAEIPAIQYTLSAKKTKLLKHLSTTDFYLC